MTLTLNTVSGVLHRSARCAGRDSRFHYALNSEPEMDLIGVFLPLPNLPYAPVVRRCRKCLR